MCTSVLAINGTVHYTHVQSVSHLSAEIRTLANTTERICAHVTARYTYVLALMSRYTYTDVKVHIH